MITIKFTKQEIQALDYERYYHPHPRVQRKIEALWLKSHKMQHKEICLLTGVSSNTLQSYFADYQQGGIEKLKELNFYHPQSKLVEHRGSIETYFCKHPPASAKEAMAKIEELTGIRRSENRVREFLKSIGMNRRKVGMIPAKADPDEQETFKKKNWNLVSMKLKTVNGLSFL